jgi:hypothetical protein
MKKKKGMTFYSDIIIHFLADEQIEFYTTAIMQKICFI